MLLYNYLQLLLITTYSSISTKIEFRMSGLWIISYYLITLSIESLDQPSSGLTFSGQLSTI